MLIGMARNIGGRDPLGVAEALRLGVVWQCAWIGTSLASNHLSEMTRLAPKAYTWVALVRTGRWLSFRDGSNRDAAGQAHTSLSFGVSLTLTYDY